MRILLCSVGTSWAVVPEAMQLLGSQGFDEVHVLTTASSKISPGVEQLLRYFEMHPGPRFSISRVQDFEDLRSEQDHMLFEEVLWRWLLQRAPQAAHRYICLAGGYKTISAAMQRAAALFGACEVFHVLCEPRFGPQGNREASTLEEVEQAIATNALRFVRLGPEPGWPQLRLLSAPSFPLESTLQGPVHWVRASDMRLRQHVEGVLERSRHILAAWEGISELPIPALAAWPPSHLRWLHEPLDPVQDKAWVQALPKVELHCHLGGFATHGELLHKVRQEAANPERLPPVRAIPLPPGWPIPEEPIGLERYMRLGDNNGSALLKDPGCLRAQCRLLYEALLADHVAYAEIRCSPANYASASRSPWVVLQEIRNHFQQAMEETPEDRRCHVNLLLTATREEGGDRSRIARHLALAITAAEHWKNGCRVVGVDLAGFEDRTTRAAMFATDFEPVHRVGLAVTVHAGENDDVEGIWQAVFKLSARRLGHALHLSRSPDLLRVVAERGIAVELCPYANLQIKGFPLDEEQEGSETYPLRGYLAAGVAVTLNTDNLGISQASLTDNLLLTARLCPGITRLEVLKTQVFAAQAAFANQAERKALWARLAQVPVPTDTEQKNGNDAKASHQPR
ncbi:Aminodeoxyfutalosine deaminase [bacterium HR09]|nr:Aminodeoxyfutalosine deaminase [bacterium HR09]